MATLLRAQARAVGEGKPIELSKLPPHLPDHVVLYLGKENLFPYRLEYCRFEPNPKGRHPPPRDGILVAVEIFDVAANIPIPATQFLYNPGNMEFTDQTETYLQSLRGKK